jgi:hypothetical protein
MSEKKKEYNYPAHYQDNDPLLPEEMKPEGPGYRNAGS